jgi:hypothetical protein
VGTVDAMMELRLDPAERLEPAIRRIAGAIAQARLEGVRRMLVVVPDGAVRAPSTAERMAMVRSWAEAAGGRVRLAVVVPRSLIDPERVGVVTAARFGMEGEVFEDESEARAWLEFPA